MYTSMGHKVSREKSSPPPRFLQTTLKGYSSSDNCSNPSENTATQKVPFEDIKIPKVKAQPANEAPVQKQTEDSTQSHLQFSFEKKRLKELGAERISKYKIDGPITEIDKEDPRAVRVSLYNEAILAKELSAINFWSSALKKLGISLTLWSILEVVFSMIFTFIMALYQQSNILKNTIPMIVNILESVWMISVGLRGGSLSGTTDPESVDFSRHIKFTIATILALLLQFVIMPCIESIPKNLHSLGGIGENGDTDESAAKRSDAFMGLSYIVVWTSAAINAVGCAICLWFTLVLRKYMRLRDIHALEQKTLPLGYQVYAKLPPQEQGISVPYNL